jgi:hypothetical protein
MMRSKVLRSAFAALIAYSGALAPVTVNAADPVYPAGAAIVTDVNVLGDGATKFVPLGVGKTVVIDLPRDAKDVLVADPKIANAVVRTSRRVYLIGVAVGQTNVFFFDESGAQIVGFDIAVTPTSTASGPRSSACSPMGTSRWKALPTASCCPALWPARWNRSRLLTWRRGSPTIPPRCSTTSWYAAVTRCC